MRWSSSRIERLWEAAPACIQNKAVKGDRHPERMRGNGRSRLGLAKSVIDPLEIYYKSYL